MQTTDTFGWLEGPNGEVFSTEEAAVIGVHIVTAEEAFKPIPQKRDAATIWLEQHDPERGIK